MPDWLEDCLKKFFPDVSEHQRRFQMEYMDWTLDENDRVKLTNQHLRNEPSLMGPHMGQECVLPLIREELDAIVANMRYRLAMVAMTAVQHASFDKRAPAAIEVDDGQLVKVACRLLGYPLRRGQRPCVVTETGHTYPFIIPNALYVYSRRK